MKRRDFITLVGGAAAWPIAARAQRGGVRWIGVLLIWNDDPLGRRLTALFEQSLGELGWTVGRNLAIDYRWGVTDLEKARPAVAVRKKQDASSYDAKVGEIAPDTAPLYPVPSLLFKVVPKLKDHRFFADEISGTIIIIRPLDNRVVAIV